MIFVAGHTGMVGSSILRILNKNGNKKVLTKSRSELDFTDIYPQEAEDEDGEDIEVLREEYNAGIQRNNELNAELQNSINELNAKIDETAKAAVAAAAKPPVEKKKKKKKKWYKRIFSDVRLKRDIEYVGLENGFNTYEFRYIWGTQRYKGVMAQEVMKTKPQAVDKLFGIYRVDYDELGVEFNKC